MKLKVSYSVIAVTVQSVVMQSLYFSSCVDNDQAMVFENIENAYFHLSMA